MKNLQMKCSNCGNEIKTDNKFCPACGKEIENEGIEIKEKIKRRNTKIIFVIGIILLTIIIVYFAFFSNNKTDMLTAHAWVKYDITSDHDVTTVYHFNKDGTYSYTHKWYDPWSEEYKFDQFQDEEWTLHDNKFYKGGKTYTYIHLNNDDLSRDIILAEKNNWFLSDKYLVFNKEKYCALSSQEEEEIINEAKIGRVEGTWVISKDSGSDSTSNKQYYTFFNDGKAEISLGTMEIIGTWNEDTDKKISIDISYLFNGTFNYKITGDSVNNRELVLSNEEDNSTEFVSATKKEIELKVSDSFEVDKDIIGDWRNEEIGMEYEFKEDGRCEIKQSDIMNIYGVYVVEKENGLIKVNYVSKKEESMEIKYEVKNSESIRISGANYKKISK